MAVYSTLTVTLSATIGEQIDMIHAILLVVWMLFGHSILLRVFYRYELIDLLID